MNQPQKKISLSGIVSIVLCIIFIPIIVINVILIVNSYITPDQLPGVFGIRPAVVLSGSMEPTIKTGDLIFIHDTKPESLKEGDVICYLSAGKAITHRIMEVTTGEDGAPAYITQGDANNTEDRQPVTADQVQGIWKGGRIGGMGNFVLFMQTTTGMILFIVCPVLLFLLWDFIKRSKADRLEKKRTSQLEQELETLKRELDQNPSAGTGSEGRQERKP